MSSISGQTDEHRAPDAGKEPDETAESRPPSPWSWQRTLRDEIWQPVVVLLAVLYLFGGLLDRSAFVTHEGVTPYIRTQQIDRELASGHVPPLALPDAVFGAGSAFPVLYPPLSYWVSVAFSRITGDYVLGVHLSFLLSVALSGLSMYWMGVVVSGNRWASLAAALVYVSTPYRFVEVFIRGALAEAWTFPFYPVIVAGAWKTIRREGLPWYLPAALAGLALSHTISALYVIPLCGALAGVALWVGGWRRVLDLILGGALAIGLSAWFLVPQREMFELVRVSDPEVMIADNRSVGAQRVSISDMFVPDESKWIPHLDRMFAEAGNGDPVLIQRGAAKMSTELGAGQIAVLPLALAVVIFVFVRRRVPLDVLALSGALFGLWVLSIAFMIWPLAFLRYLPGAFMYIQFPWRMLGSSSFLASALYPLLATCLPLSRSAHVGLAVAAALVVLLVPAYQTEKWQKVSFTSASLTATFLRDSGGKGYTFKGEYLPRELDLDSVRANLDRLPVSTGGVSIRSFRKQGLDVDLVVDSPGEGTIVLPLVYFPFHHASGDDERLRTSSVGGFLCVDVPPGTASIAIRRTPSPSFWIGLTLGAAALGCISWLEITKRRRAL